jgi:hypothetical protein
VVEDFVAQQVHGPLGPAGGQVQRGESFQSVKALVL